MASAPETSKDLFSTSCNKIDCVTQSFNKAQWGSPCMYKGSSWEIEDSEHNVSTGGHRGDVNK